MTDDELNRYLNRLKLSDRGRSYIRTVRSSPPSRRVRCPGNNVVSYFRSLKMGFTLTLESHHNELAAAYEFEHTSNVLAFFDQPEPITLRYRSKSGQPKGHRHTPNFLVLEKDAAGWVEVKQESALAKRADANPEFFVQEASGTWRCPPAEEVAHNYGFFYRIRSSSQFDPNYIQNFTFLSQYLRTDCPEVPGAIKGMILDLVKQKPGIRLDMLRESCGLETLDAVWILLAKNELYIDLRALPLADVGRVCVFGGEETARAFALTSSPRNMLPALDPRNPHTDHKQVAASEIPPCSCPSDAHSEFRNPDFTDKQLGHQTSSPSLQSESASLEHCLLQKDEAKRIFMRATEPELAIANRRLELLRDPQRAREEAVPERTLYRYRAAYRKAEQLLGQGYLGLLPRTLDRGNRTRKLSDRVLHAFEDVFKNEYCTPKRKNKRAAYGSLVLACDKRGIPPPSYSWFADAINRKNQHAIP